MVLLTACDRPIRRCRYCHVTIYTIHSFMCGDCLAQYKRIPFIDHYKAPQEKTWWLKDYFPIVEKQIAEGQYFEWKEYLQRILKSYGNEEKSNESLDLTMNEKEIESEDLDSNFTLSEFMDKLEQWEPIEYYDITNVPMADEVIEIKVTQPVRSWIMKFFFELIQK